MAFTPQPAGDLRAGLNSLIRAPEWAHRHVHGAFNDSRPPADRQRLKKLAQAALNADETVDQVNEILGGLGTTLAGMDNTVAKLDAIDDLEPDALVKFAETIDNGQRGGGYLGRSPHGWVFDRHPGRGDRRDRGGGAQPGRCAGIGGPRHRFAAGTGLTLPNTDDNARSGNGKNRPPQGRRWNSASAALWRAVLVSRGRASPVVGSDDREVGLEGEVARMLRVEHQPLMVAAEPDQVGDHVQVTREAGGIDVHP